MADADPRRDYFLTTDDRSRVSINFILKTVSLYGPTARYTRTWPLTNNTRISGSRMRVRIHTFEDVRVEVVTGPRGFCMPHPEPEPGINYVYLEGEFNRYEVVKPRRP